MSRRILLTIGLIVGLTLCMPVPAAPVRPAAPGPAPAERAAQTLIVANMWRLRGLYPGDPQLDGLERRLGDLAAHPRVRGRLLDISLDPATFLAYGRWDRDPTTASVNAVAAQIKAQIDRIWQEQPQLAYLVIVGDDRVIPFLRVPDRSIDDWPELQSEPDYATLAGIPAATTVGQALRDGQILTDDYYAYRNEAGPELAPRYYLPSLGVGRLVETPAEMLAVVETFLGGDTLVLRSVAVSARAGGFAEDLARDECARFARAGLRVDCSLVTDDWTASAFYDRLLAAGARNDILALQHHAGHLWFGSDGEFIYACDLAGAETDLTRALLISVGCHAGLSVPPFYANPSLDLAQAALGRRANLLACTGYGIAGQWDIRWSEALIVQFEQALLSDVEPTPGRALVTAKAAYHAATYDLGETARDAKASLELTFYGLPMYRYLLPAADEGQGSLCPP